MVPSWRVRAAIVVGSWVAVMGVMLGLEMGPQPLLLLAIGTAVAAALWLLVDLSDVAAPVAWYADHDSGGARRGVDGRMQSIHRQLVNAPMHGESRTMHTLLVDLIDERLLAKHAIDRRAEPDRAAVAMGPALTAVVHTPPSAKRLGDPTFLSTLLSQIESL